MRVTQAYRKLILEQDFENDPVDHTLMSNKAYAEKYYTRKLTDLTSEAMMLEKKIETLDKRGMINSLRVLANPMGHLEYRYFDDSPHEAYHICILDYPLNKHPEIKQQVLKMCKKFDEIYQLQVKILHKLDEMNFTPFSLSNGVWTFIPVANGPLQK